MGFTWKEKCVMLVTSIGFVYCVLQYQTVVPPKDFMIIFYVLIPLIACVAAVSLFMISYWCGWLNNNAFAQLRHFNALS